MVRNSFSFHVPGKLSFDSEVGFFKKLCRVFLFGSLFSLSNLWISLDSSFLEHFWS